MAVSDELHTPATLPPDEIAPTTHFIGCWVGARADLDAVKTRKIFCLCWELDPNSLAIQPLSRCCPDKAILAPYIRCAMLTALKHKHNCNGHGGKMNKTKGQKLLLDVFQFVGIRRHNRIPKNRAVLKIRSK
jgi:hypothetical protein